MITREQLEDALNDDSKQAFVTKGIDHDVKVITLLRERIPYEKCKNIIGWAEHDVIYLCDVRHVLDYLTEEDLTVLADCNCWIDDDNDSLGLFI